MPMIHTYIQAILEIHETSVAKWHTLEIDNPYEGFLQSRLPPARAELPPLAPGRHRP